MMVIILKKEINSSGRKYPMNPSDRLVSEIEIAVTDLEDYAKRAFIDHLELRSKRKKIMELVHKLRQRIK